MKGLKTLFLRYAILDQTYLLLNYVSLIILEEIFRDFLSLYFLNQLEHLFLIPRLHSILKIVFLLFFFCLLILLSLYLALISFEDDGVSFELFVRRQLMKDLFVFLNSSGELTTRGHI